MDFGSICFLPTHCIIFYNSITLLKPKYWGFHHK